MLTVLFGIFSSSWLQLTMQCVVNSLSRKDSAARTQDLFDTRKVTLCFGCNDVWATEREWQESLPGSAPGMIPRHAAALSNQSNRSLGMCFSQSARHWEEKLYNRPEPTCNTEQLAHTYIHAGQHPTDFDTPCDSCKTWKSSPRAPPEAWWHWDAPGTVTGYMYRFPSTMFYPRGISDFIPCQVLAQVLYTFLEPRVLRSRLACFSTSSLRLYVPTIYVASISAVGCSLTIWKTFVVFFFTIYASHMFFST